MATRKKRLGLWMVGACGGVGSTVALGLAASKKFGGSHNGMVTELPPFSGLGLCEPADVIVGGHEIRAASLLDGVEALHRGAGLFDRDLIRAATGQLRSWQRNIRPGTLCGAGRAIRKLAGSFDGPKERTAASALERLVDDLVTFRSRCRCDSIVVVHVASSEPRKAKSAKGKDYATMMRSLGRSGSTVLDTSSLYALAAVQARCAYINFTPSVGIDVPAIRAQAAKLALPYMGKDGKTGETLVKSVLAPMFAMRNLEVLSWVGQNILGNRDGAILSDPQTRQAKIRTKNKTVSKLTPEGATTRVSIDYVPSLDDWKVAWDFIHFRGFLGQKMSLQFTWCGSDSVLAAPLIIDLARLAEFELRHGRGGPMRHLACFFKDPLDVAEYDLFTQWRRLLEHVGAVGGSD